MNLDTIVLVFAPLGLIILMWGLGLNLSREDFARIKQSPREVIVMLLIQLILVPGLAMLLNWAFQLNPAFSMGLLLLASTPGGPTANVVSRLARGNVALNVTLTAVNSVIGIFYVPLVVFWGYRFYFNEAHEIPPQVGKLIQVVLIILIPMSLGMWMNRRNPKLSARFEKPVNRFGIFFLLFLAVLGVAGQFDKIMAELPVLILPILLFNLGAMGMGWISSVIFGFSRPDQVAVVTELGIHNCTLALGIAISPTLLGNFDIGLPTLVYLVVMYSTAGILIWLYRRSPVTA